jgi:hypothetical protein
MTSVAAALALFLAAIPKIIGFVIILVAGWFISSLIARGLAVILRKINFNELAQRSGFSGFIDQMGVRCDASGLIAETAKWFVRLLTLIVAFDALGLTAVSGVLHQLLLWLPNLVVALVILVIAGLAANALANVVRGATAKAGFHRPDFLASAARVAVWGFGIIVALNQIGIAYEIVNALFIALVGALALALGLAFGLGGRETAAEIVREWYQQSKESGPKIAQAAELTEAELRARGSTTEPTSMHRNAERRR